MPCHNYGRFVSECVASVVSQSLFEMGQVEVIVLDDGSTDGSWDVIQQLARLTDIRALRNATNLGHVATINKLISDASGKLVAVLDADDLAADRDALRSQVTALDAEPDAGIACGDYMLVDDAGRPIGMERVDAPVVLRARDAFGRLLLANFIPHSGTLVRREAYARLGAHDPKFHYSHDWELWLRLTSQYGVVRVARPLYRYRMHARSLRRTAHLEQTVPEFEAVLERARGYSPISGLEFDRRRRRGIANMQVLRGAVYLSRGLVWPGLADLRAGLRTDARAIVTRRVPRALASAVLAIVFRSRKDRLIRFVRRFVARAGAQR